LFGFRIFWKKCREIWRGIYFKGGLIGDSIKPEQYEGDFSGTPIFIGSSNPDFHVPVERVHATSNIFRDLGAIVTEKIYQNMGHTIIKDEINEANKKLNHLISTYQLEKR
jgi:phospholipase/carboxylesterase